MARGGKSQQKSKNPGRPKGAGPTVIIDHIRSIAPPLSVSSLHVHKTQTVSAIEHLKCPVCLEILSQPVEMPCRALVCASCVISWLITSACSKCPCCFSDTPLDPASINPAPSLILKLLGEVLVCCPVCNTSVNVGVLDMHQCTPQVQSVSKDLQVTSTVIQELLSKSPDNVLEIPTGGTVSHLIHTCRDSVVIINIFYVLKYHATYIYGL